MKIKDFLHPYDFNINMIIVSDTTIGQTLPGDCGGEQGRGHGHALPRRQVTEDRLTGSES